MCKIDSWWEPAMKNREHGLVRCDDLDVGGVWGGRKEQSQKEGVYAYM